MDSVVKILCTYAAIGYEISPSVAQFIERIIEDHAPYNQHFEVAWALWLARSLEIRLSSTASALVLRVENDICAMLALLLRGRKLLSGGSQISSWLGPVTAQDLRGNHWLLLYEAASRKSWPIKGATAAVAGDSLFSGMQAEGVSFFDSRAYNRPLNLPGIESQLRKALKGRSRALLPGAIMTVQKRQQEASNYEQLGGDYGDVDDDFGLPNFFDDDGDEPAF